MKLAPFLLFGVIALSAAACLAPKRGGDSGKQFVASSVHNSATETLAEAVRRAGTGSLNRPFIVATHGNRSTGIQLFQFSVAPEKLEKLDAKRLTPDQLLDQASIEILSKEGISPFYDYCFGPGEHAQTATVFCTHTLVPAMKIPVSD